MNSSPDLMSRTTIIALFDNYGDAVNGARAVEESGVPPVDITLFSDDPRDAPLTPSEGAGVGGGMGAAIGGGAGLLAALGVLGIPGLGPVVAAGWVVATLVGAAGGAAAGSVIGALTSSGASDEDAHVFAESLSRGGAIVTVEAAESRLAMAAERILKNCHAVDVKRRGDEYHQAGWTHREATGDFQRLDKDFSTPP